METASGEPPGTGSDGMQEAEPRRVDANARKELAELQEGRRHFLKKAAIGAGLIALGAGLGFGGGYVSATGFGGETVITDTEIAARVIAGVRIATEFIPSPVPAGTDADPYPGSAIQAALNDGVAVYIPSGTWKLTSTIARAVNNVTIIGAGNSTKLLLDGATPVISAGTQTGWLIADLATDAGGVDISSASQTRMTEIWINGVLTDNRPIATGGGGSGGFYGVRASDYITSGTGTDSDPYNASAIASAVNALPSQGGIVFIKAGIWRGSKIYLGGTGNPGDLKTIIFMGEGCIINSLNQNGNFGYNFGTDVQCGFEVINNRCIVSFYNMALGTNPPGSANYPVLKLIQDGNYSGQNYLQTSGTRIENCLFHGGHPALWWTSRNVSKFSDPVSMYWNNCLDRVGFTGGGTAIKIDNGDAPNDNGSFLVGSMRNIFVQHQTTVAGARAIDINISGLQLQFGPALIEDAGGAGADYALKIRCNSYWGGTIDGINFGDNSNANKDAGFECDVGPGITARNITHGYGVDLIGYGEYEIGSGMPVSGSPGNVNITAYGGASGGGITLRKAPGYPVRVGTIANPQNTRIIRSPNSTGYIGTTTPTGSPYTYTNNDSCDECVYLVGGSVSGVARNATSIGTATTHLLAPGDSITISYSAAPILVRFSVS